MASKSTNVLNHQGVEVVRAIYFKEVALSTDPDREITFGDHSVRLADVQVGFQVGRELSLPE